MSVSIAAMFRPGLLASAMIAGLGLTSPGLAQSTVYIPAILELSGAGAVSGTNFRDGMLLAIDEINAKGGFLTPVIPQVEPPATSTWPLFISVALGSKRAVLRVGPFPLNPGIVES